MEAIYRIYDTIEKIHRNDMFVGVNGLVYETRLLRLAPTKEMGEYITVISEAKNQSLYIVERCTGLYDKNKVLIFGNDIAKVGGYVEGFMPIQAIVFNRDEGSLGIYDSRGGRHNLGGLDIEILGHAIRDEHLLSDK